MRNLTAIAVLIGSAIIVAAAFTIAWCTHANAEGLETVSPAEVAAVANQVVEVLRRAGYDVEVGELPLAYIVRVDDGNVAETPGGSIRVDERLPIACRTRLLAHELTHIIVARSYGAVGRDEALADAIEHLVVPDYQPGCERLLHAPVSRTVASLRGAVL